MTLGTETAVAARPRTRIVSLLVAIRPRQWMKNTLVFAGLLFAAETDDVDRWSRAIAAFCAYCALSSAAYLLNDLRDLEHDRLHPLKRLRPLARGDLSQRVALAASGVLAAAGMLVAGALGPPSLAYLGAFAGLQIGYTLALKRLPIVDVLAITTLFVIRAAAGAAAAHVRISPWLLGCTALLALFLALAKRQGELALVIAGQTPGRAVLGRYSLPLLDRLLWLSAGGAISAYVLYTLAVHDWQEMLTTVPFVASGLGRYLYLVHHAGAGEEPEQVLFSDPLIIASVGLWIASATLMLTQ
jgi:4-hydroxybenzoate polyprenyltransferase